MICPYCKEAMQSGVIQSPHEISWLPVKSRFFGKTPSPEDALVLSELSLRHGDCVEAFRCETCKKVIIDYSEDIS